MLNSTWINTIFEWCVELLTYLAQNLGTTYQALKESDYPGKLN